MPKRVLIVDDAVFMRDMIKDIFSGGGADPDPAVAYEIVGEALHGVEAVEKYKELRPDLVTMDIVMPFKSGIEATKEILAFDERATIIMCSALGQESLVMEAIEAGAADFIVKPFKADDVLAVVHKVLARGK
jgi:two-component system chemotaxis response regulator CheY